MNHVKPTSCSLNERFLNQLQLQQVAGHFTGGAQASNGVCCVGCVHNNIIYLHERVNSD